MRSYAQLNVIVTGANRGIGLALVRHLLSRGAEVFAGARDPDGATELKALGGADKKLTVHRLDVTDDRSVKAFCDAYQAPSLDLLINSAGVNLEHGPSLTTLSPETLIKTLDVNTVGPLRMIQGLEKRLRASDKPMIANISSVMGSIQENESGGSGGYRISKTALNMLSRTLALEEPDILTLALHPGWVKTRMGGKNAQIDVDTSAQGLLEVIAQATKAESGGYVRYSGETIPW